MAGVSERLFVDVVEEAPMLLFDGAVEERAIYLEIVRSVLCHHAVEGSFVYHGHAAHLLLAGLPNLLRVRVVAPFDYRVQAVIAELRLSRREAQCHVRRADARRARWLRFLYGRAYQDAPDYDLTLNVGLRGVAEAAEVVCDAARRKRQEWTQDALCTAEDASLAHKVIAALALSRELYRSNVEVWASSGHITISGRARDDLRREALSRIAAQVPGVLDVRLDVHVPSDYLHS